MNYLDKQTILTCFNGSLITFEDEYVSIKKTKNKTKQKQSTKPTKKKKKKHEVSYIMTYNFLLKRVFLRYSLENTTINSLTVNC